MNNLKIIIPIIIVFVIVISGIYYLYQKQVIKQEEISPSPSQVANFPSTPSPQGQALGSTSQPNSQPETGSDTINVQNIGIKVDNPKPSDKISSPVTVNGSANVFEGHLVILIKDANGNVLGQKDATACMDYDACKFEASVAFTKPAAQTGTVEVYNPSGVDGSPEYLQTIPVEF